jgi:hypothetical protein
MALYLLLLSKKSILVSSISYVPDLLVWLLGISIVTLLGFRLQGHLKYAHDTNIGLDITEKLTGPS